MRAGLTAPFDSLRFLLRHKGVLAALLAVHLVVCVGYFFLVVMFALPWASAFVATATVSMEPAFLHEVIGWAVRVSVFIVAFLAYPLLGLPVANLP